MDFFGIGLQEIFFIVIILLLVFGPRDLARHSREFGRWLNRLVRSDQYRAIQTTARELRGLPERLMREAQLEDLQKLPDEVSGAARSIRQETQAALDAWQPERKASEPPPTIAPPRPTPPRSAPPADGGRFDAWLKDLPPEPAPESDPPGDPA